MNAPELKALNAELIALLISIREKIDEMLDDLGLGSDDDSEDIEDG